MIPAEAFVERVPQDLPPGSIFLLRDSWAFRVDNQADPNEHIPSFVMLQGERVGKLCKVVQGMPPCLTLIEPFGWFAAVQEGAIPGHQTMETASLSVTSTGIVLVGVIRDQWGNEDAFGFGMKGQFIGEAPRGAVRRFAKWSAELCHPNRPFVSLGRLFEVDRNSADSIN
ncbi:MULTISPECIES: hypothetical protein [Xanthomonas]|uniref:hypothetical protein n=1 Tax=Xanthomonas TaxID=338 RepID=UPI0003B03B95|nr:MULTISPECIES: hypothetical protein [Xanthomonas]MCW3193409.1 hypothetical protein [Xanthomonas citri pv. fuscans]CDF60957.1 hypothetical protein XFF4834R_chr13690 [Xanthomonas citri pv. fuscans]SON88991.1 conserved hypothetical protein [Xanthomonas citri pv. fuscans]SOO03868.1 conserved hypothetical protein [Xanthomonas citri pv. fuscans]SOO03980.1 conserved hypothetical protein [Xanthomonas citri pv. fuscans]